MHKLEPESTNALAFGRERLKSAKIESYALDALVLLCFAIGKTKEWLLSHDYRLTKEETAAYSSYIKLREKRMPVQYITNECEFMSLPFYVDENVLIPRADTELLAERVIEAAKRLKSPKTLDLCTGSGCIAVSAAHYCLQADVTGADISGNAVRIALKNAEQNGVAERIRFVRSDLFDALGGETFDIIASNPPYIAESEMCALPPSVRDYEPTLALDGGAGGLVFYKLITREAARFLNAGGRLFFECGFGQSAQILEIMNQNGYNNINIYKDLAGIERVIEGTIKGVYSV